MSTRINNSKIKILLIVGAVAIGGVGMVKYLMFVPEYSQAISTDTPVVVTPTTPLAKWEDLQYMQQMTSQACNSAPISTASTGNANQKQLIDVRDGKTYWVARIGDDCWMTQNLDYDDPGSTKVTDTSGTNGGPGSSYWEDSNSKRQYWDPGDNKTAKAGSSALTTLLISKEEDKHYLIGNYYSWISATAGVTNGTPTSSITGICPDAWQLPTNNSGTSVKTFQALTNALGATSGTSGGRSDAKLIASPGYFMRGGRVSSGWLNAAGSYGYYWSSTPDGSDNAFNLNFSSGSVTPSDNNDLNRPDGHSVRCVAKDTSEITPVDPSVGGETGINDPNVSVTVPKMITLDVYSGDEESKTVDIAMKGDGAGTGKFTAKVSSNAGYDLALSTVDGGHTELRNEKANVVIPALSVTVTTDSESWWGVKCADVAGCKRASYAGLTNDMESYFAVENGGNELETIFEVGVKAAPELPSGTYSTSILVTASQK